MKNTRRNLDVEIELEIEELTAFVASLDSFIFTADLNDFTDSETKEQYIQRLETIKARYLKEINNLIEAL